MRRGCLTIRLICNEGRLLRGSFITAIYAYLYIPIVILIINSFNSSRFGINWQGFTTKWYGLLMNNDSLLEAARHSLTMAVMSATFATLIGALTAVALYRYRFRGKPFVSGMLFVVMMSPDIVMAISLLVLFMLLASRLASGRCCSPTSPSACRLWWSPFTRAIKGSTCACWRQRKIWVPVS